MTGPLIPPVVFANATSPESTTLLDKNFDYQAAFVLDTVAQLRLTTPTIGASTPPRVWIGGTTQGVTSWWYNPADTTSVDNGTSIVVAADGGRWYVQPPSTSYIQTDAEIANGSLPVNYDYAPGNINRYGDNDIQGVTDMAVAFQAALNTGAPVYIPAGTYLISAACQAKTQSQLIYGDGQLSILLTPTDIETINTDTSVFGVVIRDIQFNNTYVGGGGGPTHFHLHFGTGASGCSVIRCGFNTALTGSVVSTSFNAGVWFEGGNLNNILDCTFGQAQILMGSTDATIRGGYVYSFSFEYAIKIVSAGEVVVDAVRGILGGPGQGCIWIPSPSYMVKIVNNYFGGSLSTINIGNGITAVQPQMLQVLGNTFHEIDGIGISITDPASGCVFGANEFFAGDPKQNAVLAGVMITGTAGQFSCTATTLVVGSPVVIKGTYGGTGSISGYTNPTTYYIITTNGTTTFTLSATKGGSAITTTTGTPSGLTYTNGSVPGKQDILIQSSSFGASSVVIQGNNSNRFDGPIEDGMPGLGKSNAIEIQSFSGVANNLVRHNTVSGSRYYYPGVVDPNINDSVGDNPGAPVVYDWTPSDLSGAGLTFTSVTAKYISDTESVTFWGELTFPTTANSSLATLGGLPFSVPTGMAGGVAGIITNNATAQKIRLVDGQAYFFLTNTVDVPQTNATCSGSYFQFHGRYLKQ